MSQLAAIVMQGLGQGTSDARQNGDRQQQLMMLAHKLGQEQAAKKAYLARLDQFNPAPPQMIGQDLSGGEMGPPSQVENPDFAPWQQTREALAGAPNDVLDQVVGGYEQTAKAQRMAGFRQKLEEDEFNRDMAYIRSAEQEFGASAEHDNLDSFPDVLAKRKKWGLPTRPQQYTEDMVRGAMNRNPGAVSQMLNRGSMPGGLMPSANAPGQIDPQDVIDRENPDPQISGPAKARLMTTLGARSFSAVDQRSANAKPPPMTPEQVEAQAKKYIDLMGGPTKVSPDIQAQVYIQLAQSGKVTDGTLARWSQQPRDIRKVQETHLKMRLDAANMEVKARQSAVKEAMQLAGKEGKAAQDAAYAKLNAAKAFRDSLIFEHDEAPAMGPGTDNAPVPVSETATPSGTTASRAGTKPAVAPTTPADDESLMDQIYADQPNATPEQAAAEFMRRKRGPQ